MGVEDNLVHELNAEIAGTIWGFLSRKIAERDPAVGRIDPGKIVLASTMCAVVDAVEATELTNYRITRVDFESYFADRLQKYWAKDAQA